MDWLPGFDHKDLSGIRGNGPFDKFLGVVLHVNASANGTPDWFWGAGTDSNPDSVCPNFQIRADGSVLQLLPLNWQPWCQRDGNFNYAAIECAGLPNTPMAALQITNAARIVRAYHDHMGMPLDIANAPGQRGLGTHVMGGAAWGGHPCPGTIRGNQRGNILSVAKQDSGTQPHPPSPGPSHLTNGAFSLVLLDDGTIVLRRNGVAIRIL